jgi:hypothetical protein
LIKKEEEKKLLKIKKTKRKILGKTRKSQFRGFSKNGSQWQVLLMINNAKRFVGSYSSEALAARANDKVAVQYHKAKAKTNFSYSESEITQILKEIPVIRVNTN